MRITCTLFLLVLLSGCSFNAELPPVAEQTHDLFDTDGDGVITPGINVPERHREQSSTTMAAQPISTP